MQYEVGDTVKIASSTATKNEFDLDSDGIMKSMVGKEYTIDGVDGAKIKIEGFAWLADDLKRTKKADANLHIPKCGNHRTAKENGHEEVLLKTIGYVGDYLSGLHNTDVFKKGREQVSVYDGSGHLFLEGIPDNFARKTKLEILQRKKTGFIRDKPDILLMIDNSSSMASNQLPNHVRVLSCAIADVFFAEINKVYVITFGHGSKYMEFDDKNEFVDKMLNGVLFDEGATQYELAFQQAITNACLKEQTRPRLVLLVTDGVPTQLANSVENELNKLRSAGEFKKDDAHQKYKDLLMTKTKKSTLLRSIDMISSLSALSNTVFRSYVLSDSKNPDYTFGKIADETAARLKGAEEYDEEAKVLIRRFVNELMKNGMIRHSENSLMVQHIIQ